MSPRIFSLTILLLAAFVTGCASRVATYSGSRRSLSEVALIPYYEAQSDIRVVSVDGRRVTSSKADLELLPGQRTLEVVYTPPKTAHSYPVRLSFNAEAHHSYALSAKILHGSDRGAGFWEGKYQAFIYDLSPVREVGRSAGPAAEGPKPNHG